MEAFRNVGVALLAAIVHVRVWLFSWLVLTGIAAIVVWPAWSVLDDVLSNHPGAGFHLDQSLDADLWRTRPELTLPLGGALLAALLFGAFLSGGVVATVGRADRPFRFAELLGEGGFTLLRATRVLAIGLGIALVLFWGFDLLEGWLVDGRLAAAEPGAIVVRLGFTELRWSDLLELFAWLEGAVFVGLVYVTKIAIADLALTHRSSAFLAVGRALGRVARRPLRTVLIVGCWLVLWGLGSHLIGEVTVRLLEVRRDLVWGAIAGQLGIVFGQWILIGMLVSARQFGVERRQDLAG